MILRTATDRDWASIYPFYRVIMAEGETYAFPEGQTIEEARPWWMEQPPGQTIVAVDDNGDVTGSAKIGPNRPGRGRHIATASFLVAPAHQGKGVGRALGHYVIDWARAEGYHGKHAGTGPSSTTGSVGVSFPRFFQTRTHSEPLGRMHPACRSPGPADLETPHE